MNYYHIPVLTDEVVKFMNLRARGVYVDCTVGGGGHSIAMLETMPNIQLYCIDQDDEAIRSAKKRLIGFQKQVTFIQDNFVNIKTSLALAKINKVDGILMDIGVSNHQLASARRGFSFMMDGVLDMRMGREIRSEKCEVRSDGGGGDTAADIINNYSLEELTRIFFEYGEEQFSKKIAGAIVSERDKGEIKTTTQLAEIIESCVPKAHSIKSKARIFQAIRIEVNNELDVLSHTLKDAVSLLKTGGRLVVISWHSLEDRIVKNFFRAESGSCTCPPELPVCHCKKRQRLSVLTRKAVRPSAEEVARNGNARSARLRVAERIMK